MLELQGKFGTAKVFTDVVDNESISQVINLLNAIDLDEPEGFIKVGHIDGVINRRRTNDSQGCPSKSSS